MFFAKPLQRSNLCASHRQRRWLTHGELQNHHSELSTQSRRLVDWQPLLLRPVESVCLLAVVHAPEEGESALAAGKFILRRRAWKRGSARLP